jgi:DNA-directed RNA polymerase specialized sigma24 family protein
MRSRSTWIKAALLLAVVWIVAGGLIWWARANKVTPEALMAYVESHPIEGKSPGERGKTVESVAKKLNHLTYEERREVRLSRRLDRFFKTLNPDEQSRFLDLTLPEGFRQMMEALNKMEPEKRKAFVERTLEQLRKDEGMDPEEARERFEKDGNIQKIIDQGLKSFYSDASAETKMDLAPVIEQMQRNLESFGPR